MTDDSKAADVFATWKYGTHLCVVCRVNFPIFGSVTVDGLRAGYCRACVVGIAKLKWTPDLDDATDWLREVIRKDTLEQEPNILKVREAVQKIAAKRHEP